MVRVVDSVKLIAQKTSTISTATFVRIVTTGAATVSVTLSSQFYLSTFIVHCYGTQVK